MFRKVLVANRGAVAARIIRALGEMGIASVAIYSDADRDAPYLEAATEARHVGPSPARESYLDIDRILSAARDAKVDALHPGYGFLSESVDFAAQTNASAIRFIGPRPDMIAAMGHKTNARDLVRRYGMPMNPGSGVLPTEPEAAVEAADAFGYPVLIKPAAGGGGIGMLAAHNREELLAGWTRASSLAMRSFGNQELYLERLVDRPRHIEVQVLGDSFGQVRHLFERDCSVQRRHQKVIEEARAPGLSIQAADELGLRIAEILRQIGYDNIGTVEMLMGSDGSFHFLEMNTRLQVEHGVTEEVTGVDLVKAQIRSAAGERLDAILPAIIQPSGHAIEARIYAEDPKRFLPSPGLLKVLRFARRDDVRIETGYREGGEITHFYDPLIAKVIAKAATRGDAIAALDRALVETEIDGVRHNVPALLAVLRSPEFRAGDVHTGLLSTIELG